MGNYRPKSLDELGNMYGKSIEADNEIKKGSSMIGAIKAPAHDGFSEEKATDVARLTPQQEAADEIASKVGDFAKNFGSAATNKVPASIATVQSRPRVPKKKPEAPSPTGGKRVPVQKETKSRLIRNSERTNLFDSYKKVMNDEEDSGFDFDDQPVKRNSRKKKAEKKENTAAVKASASSGNEVELQAEAAIATVFGDSNSTAEQTETVAVNPIAVSDSFEKDDTQQSYDGDAAASGNPVLRILLTSVLLLVLILSVAIGSIKAFVKLNTDVVTFGGYQFYSAETNYAGTDISKNDLVFVKNRQPVSGEKIAFRESSGKYGFTTFGSAINSESMSVIGSSDKIVVFVNEYRGAVIKTVPVVGGIIAVCTNYFLPVMAVMFLLIGLLILLIFFTSKESSVKAAQIQEEPQEYEAQAPVTDAFEAMASNDYYRSYESSEDEKEDEREEIPEEAYTDGYTDEASAEAEDEVAVELQQQAEESQTEPFSGDLYYIPDDSDELFSEE